MSEIAQAFVRVRPNTRGFAGEAEGGVRSAFGHLAKIAAAAFAVERGFQFGKEIIGHAADVQKQIEAVKSEFGQASDAVIKFGEDSAAQLGISEHAAVKTAARFGIIFKNLGIGEGPAASMTIGFEKLAGSLSLIRNQDPADILARIPLAIQGNLRSLKLLGIATDQNQLKLAAFKLGLTDTVTQALTPAQRAQAIYAVSTAHLGDFLRQALAHTTDLATRQRILSAIWDNAKDRLGKGLLPVASTLVELLARGLPHALSITGKAFGDLRDVVKGFFEVVGPIFRPLIGEVRKLADAFKDGGVGGAIKRLKDDFLSLSPVGKIVAGVITGITVTLTAMVVSAAPISFLIIGIAGLAIAFKEAYDHSARFRSEVHNVGNVIEKDVLPPIRRIRDAINDAFGSGIGFVRDHLRVFEILGSAVAGAAGAFVIMKGAILAYQTAVKIATAVQLLFDGALLANPIGIIVVAIGALIGALVYLYFHSNRVRKVVDGAFDGLKRGVDAVLPTLERLVAKMEEIGAFVGEHLVGAFRAGLGIVEALWRRFGGLITSIAKNDLGALLGIARGVLQVVRGIFNFWIGLITGDWGRAWKGIKQVFSGAATAIVAAAKGLAKDFEAVFEFMWHAVEKLFLEGVEKIVGLLAKIPSVHAKIPGLGTVGFTNPFKGYDDSLKAAIAASGKSTADAAETTGKHGADAVKKAHKAVKDAVDSSAKDIVGQGADSAEAAKISSDAAAATTAASTALQTQLRNTVTTNDAAIAKMQSKIRGYGKQIAQAIKDEAKDVHDAVAQAEQNLTSIGSTLAGMIGQLIDKPLQDAQNKLSATGNKQTLENLRRQIILPGGRQLSTNPERALAQLRNLAKHAGAINSEAINAFIQQYQGAVLAVKQDQANVVKDHATRRIADLTDLVNSGKIKPGEFKTLVLAELKRDHVSYKNAGALLGIAFADGFKAQLKGLFSQEDAIAATPAGRRAGVNSLEPTIVKPLEVLRKDQTKIGNLTHKKMDAQTALQKRIAVAAEKSAKINAQLQALVINGATPTSHTKNDGKGTKRNRDLNGTTN